MPVDYFLKLAGIKGEAQDATHKGEIDVFSWSWGASQQSSGRMGGGSGTGKAEVREITIVKGTDTASTALLGALLSGRHISDGFLTCRKAGEKPLEFLKIKLLDILITDISARGGQGGETPHETVNMFAGKVYVEYYEQKADGSGKPAGQMGWDIKANEKL